MISSKSVWGCFLIPLTSVKRTWHEENTLLLRVRTCGFMFVCYVVCMSIPGEGWRFALDMEPHNVSLWASLEADACLLSDSVFHLIWSSNHHPTQPRGVACLLPGNCWNPCISGVVKRTQLPCLTRFSLRFYVNHFEECTRSVSLAAAGHELAGVRFIARVSNERVVLKYSKGTDT